MTANNYLKLSSTISVSVAKTPLHLQKLLDHVARTGKVNKIIIVDSGCNIITNACVQINEFYKSYSHNAKQFCPTIQSGPFSGYTLGVTTKWI